MGGWVDGSDLTPTRCLLHCTAPSGPRRQLAALRTCYEPLNSTSMGVGSIAFGSPHVRPRGCIVRVTSLTNPRKTPNPKGIPSLSQFEQAASNGKVAQTDWVVEERFANFALIRFRPKHGRTHQIRIHALYIGR